MKTSAFLSYMLVPRPVVARKSPILPLALVNHSLCLRTINPAPTLINRDYLAALPGQRSCVWAAHSA